jgi:hypothetical protein
MRQPAIRKRVMRDDEINRLTNTFFDIIFQQLFNKGEATFTGGLARSVLDLEDDLSFDEVNRIVHHRMVTEKGWLTPVFLTYDSGLDLYCLSWHLPSTPAD